MDDPIQRVYPGARILTELRFEINDSNVRGLADVANRYNFPQLLKDIHVQSLYLHH